MLSNQPDHHEGKTYCTAHRVYNTGACPWCTITPVEVIPAPTTVWELTDEDKSVLRGMNIDPER